MGVSIYSMCKDTRWEIRETAASILGKLCLLSPPNIDKTIFFTIFKRFHEDKRQAVKNAALLQTGKLIYSLKDIESQKYLLNIYISQSDMNKCKNEDAVFQCAYTFPAVLSTVGMNKWPSLVKVYKQLILSKITKVTMTMVASLHKIATIVGPKITINELEPISKKFLQNNQTLIVALSHLHDFLKLLTPNERLTYFPIMNQIIEKSKNNWKQRRNLAVHIGDYLMIYNEHEVHEHLLGIFYKLIYDTVFLIRIETCKHVSDIINMFKNNTEYFGEIVNLLKKLYSSTNYKDRQIFLHGCERIMNHSKLFIDNFMTDFLSLQKDKVISVRITLAKILHNHMKYSGLLATNVYITRTIELLKNDPSKEVRESIQIALDERNKVKEFVMDKEELIKLQEKAASMISLEPIEDKEAEEEARRVLNVNNVKSSIRIDEIDEELGI